MELEEGDVVLCTVEKIQKTIVFVKIHGFGKELEGSIITSEIAPGRIRNIRDYVVPNKKIVCKILRISGDRIELSLRRVTKKEKKEVIDEFNQEKSYISILKSILGEKAKEKVKEIEKKQRVYDFLNESKEDSKKLEKLLGKKDAEKVLKILKAQKSKKSILKKEFQMSSSKPDGIKIIKKLLGAIKEAKITYLSAGKYTISKESEDLKKADQELEEIFNKISKDSKKLGIEFKIKEK